jgi:hypothetical protein
VEGGDVKKPEWVTFDSNDVMLFWSSYEKAVQHVRNEGGWVEGIPSEVEDDELEDE